MKIKKYQPGDYLDPTSYTLFKCKLCGSCYEHAANSVWYSAMVHTSESNFEKKREERCRR